MVSSKKKILILGASSFAGSHFINDALKKNHHVVGISRSFKKNKNLIPYSKNKNLSNLNIYKLDLNKNLNSILNIILNFKPSIIIDFAGQGMVAQSFNNPEQWYQTNVISKIKLYKSISKIKYIEKYIKISTPEVYGSSKIKIKESFNYNPSSPYAASHAAIDTYLRVLHNYNSFPVIFARFANFYGPYQQSYRLIPNLIIKILNNKEKFILEGSGRDKRAFIHNNDISSALFSIIKKGKIGKVYHFSPEKIYSIIDIVKIICNLMNADFDKFVKFGKARKLSDAKYFMQTKNSTNELNWKNLVNIEKGINETIKYVRKNIDSINKEGLVYIHKK